MKSKSAKKAADEEPASLRFPSFSGLLRDEAKSKKIRSSRGKRRRGRHSHSRNRSPSPSPGGSTSSSPPRKRSKKPTKKIVDKRSKKNKGSRTSRRRSLSPSSSPSGSPSSVSRSHSVSSSSASDSERSVSPPPKSHSKDTRQKKVRVRDKDRKRRRVRRSRSYSSSPARSGSSRSRSRSKSKSRKRMTHDASRDRVVQDYYNCQEDGDEDAVAVATKGIDDYEKNVELKKMERSPSKDANEMGEILSPKVGNETGEILPVSYESPEVEEDLELILRQKALENFRKFKGPVAMVGKAENNGTGKEVLTDSPQNTVTKFPEVRSAVAPSQRQGSNLGVGHSTPSPEFEDFENGISPWKQEMTHGDRSPGILESGDTYGATQQQGSGLEVIRSTCHITSHDGRNGGSVMQKVGSTPPSIKQRLGISSVVNPVQARPRVTSVVSIPSREGLDGGTFTTTPTACENPASVESSSEVRHFPAEMNKLEGISGYDRKTGEASAPDSSIVSSEEGKSQAGTQDKDGSQFEKRTFSRMHDGETVQVSYKVYIPTTSPRLARRKLQR